MSAPSIISTVTTITVANTAKMSVYSCHSAVNSNDGTSMIQNRTESF